MNNDVTQSVCIKPNINEEFLLGSYLLHQAHAHALYLDSQKKKGRMKEPEGHRPAPLVPFQNATSVIVLIIQRSTAFTGLLFRHI